VRVLLQGAIEKGRKGRLFHLPHISLDRTENCTSLSRRAKWTTAMALKEAGFEESFTSVPVRNCVSSMTHRTHHHRLNGRLRTPRSTQVLSTRSLGSLIMLVRSVSPSTRESDERVSRAARECATPQRPRKQEKCPKHTH
jgi:hypothetical protein